MSAGQVLWETSARRLGFSTYHAKGVLAVLPKKNTHIIPCIIQLIVYIYYDVGSRTWWDRSKKKIGQCCWLLTKTPRDSMMRLHNDTLTPSGTSSSTLANNLYVPQIDDSACQIVFLSGEASVHMIQWPPSARMLTRKPLPWVNLNGRVCAVSRCRWSLLAAQNVTMTAHLESILLQ